MPIAQIVALLAWISMTIGVLARRNRRVHIPLMLAGIVTDTALVVHLQIARDAVQKAVSLTLDPLHQAHIALSTAAMLLYLPVVVFGVSLARGRGSEMARRWHPRLGASAYLFRTAGLLFMFAM